MSFRRLAESSQDLGVYAADKTASPLFVGATIVPDVNLLGAALRKLNCPVKTSALREILVPDRIANGSRKPSARFYVTEYARIGPRRSSGAHDVGLYCSRHTTKVNSNTWAGWVRDSARKRSHNFTESFNRSCGKTLRSQTYRGRKASLISHLAWSPRLHMRNSLPIESSASPYFLACVTTSFPRTSHCRRRDESRKNDHPSGQGLLAGRSTSARWLRNIV
jgi:hypothetical protein